MVKGQKYPIGHRLEVYNPSSYTWEPCTVLAYYPKKGIYLILKELSKAKVSPDLLGETEAMTYHRQRLTKEWLDP